MEILELANVEMGTFRARLLRKGEPYGPHYQFRYDEDEPSLEFYGPARESDNQEPGTFLSRHEARDFLTPRSDWFSVDWPAPCEISPENSREIAAWLASELARPWTPPPSPPRPASQTLAADRMELHKAGNRKATLYVRGLFGYSKQEVEWVQVYRRPYAQHADAFFIDYLPRGKRRARRIIEGDRPSLVVLLGWDHPDLQEQFVELEREEGSDGGGGLKVWESKYTSADPRYEVEFEDTLHSYLKTIPLSRVLLDLRGQSVREGSSLRRDAHEAIPVLERDGQRTEAQASAQIGRSEVPSVFVSYYHADNAGDRDRFEDEFGNAIRSSSIYPGEIGQGRSDVAVRREIRARISRCDFLVILIGSRTYRRRWVDWELHATLKHAIGVPRRPVLAILLPEMEDLEGSVRDAMSLGAAEVPSRIRQRSDDLCKQLLNTYGRTLPARLVDNLLTGYAMLARWPESPRALIDALIAAAALRGRPVNSRPLLAQNLSSAPDDSGDRSRSRSSSTDSEAITDRLHAAANPTTTAVDRTNVESVDPTAISPPPRSTATASTRDVSAATVDDDVAPWPLAPFGFDGPHTLESDLARMDGPNASVLQKAITQNGHLLAPLESPISLAATLLSRIADGDAGSQFAAQLSDTLDAPYLAPTVPLPDLAHPALVRVLRGHTKAIETLAVDPRGLWLASAGRDGMVRIWDVGTGVERHALPAHEVTSMGAVTHLAAGPTGSWLASAGVDGAVRLWDPSTGKALHTLVAAGGHVTALVVDPEGMWLAAGDSDGLVRLWETATGTERHTFMTDLGGVRALAVDPAGAWLAYIGFEPMVRVWQVSSGEQALALPCAGYSAAALLVSPDGAWLACVGGGGTIRIWSLPEGAKRRDLTNRARGISNEVEELAVDPAARWLAVGGKRGTIRIWDLASGKALNTICDHAGDQSEGVNALAVHPTGAWLASAGTDCTVRIWEPMTGVPRHILTGHTGRPLGGVKTLAVSPDGTWLASGGADGDVRIWDPGASGSNLARAINPGPIKALSADTAGTWLAFADSDGAVLVRHLATGSERQLHDEQDGHIHDGRVAALAFDPGGAWIASTGKDGTVRIWDPRDGSERYSLTDRGSITLDPTVLAISPSGAWLAVAGTDGRVRVWDPATGTKINTLAAPSRGIGTMAIHSDAWLAAAGADGGVRIWNPYVSTTSDTLIGHSSGVDALAIDPGGTWLAAAHQDGELLVWDVRTGALRYALDTGMTDTRSGRAELVASRDGRWLAYTHSDGNVQIWDPATGERRHILTGHTNRVCALAHDPTGRWLASVSEDGTVRIWDPAAGTAVASLRVDGALFHVFWTPKLLVVAGDFGPYLLVLKGV